MAIDQSTQERENAQMQQLIDAAGDYISELVIQHAGEKMTLEIQQQIMKEIETHIMKEAENIKKNTPPVK